MVEAAEHPIEDDVLGALDRCEHGLGIAEAGEGAVPFGDRAGWVVVLGSIRGPSVSRIRRNEDGPRSLSFLRAGKPGVTAKGEGERRA